ncbi:Protein translocase subunit SecF [Vibrio stylophorae]|uniref:Protein-export membrane protein SecF n=1 Tax=Vibrio stylophorae TaxID=659351 RepID=A0ABM8ZRE2_9VIBR|nr:protein translocase subunit SecF [Vibrio stylophorae]CAH0532811.1 Protein translocase subunit SecF [Vibrio stylophorae]
MKKLAMQPTISRIPTLTKVRYGGLAASLCMIIFSLFAIWHYGLKPSIDFTGGTIIDFSMPTLKTAKELLAALPAQTREGLELIAQNDTWQLILPPQPTAVDPQQWLHTFSAISGQPATLVQATVVGPQVGEELFDQGALALLVASLSIMIYLAMRFEWRLALAAIASLIHDTILTLGVLAFLGVQMDLNVIAGMLAVIGYSLNDSIVIADRLRDILRARPRDHIYISSDRAVRETFSRTLITAGTTLFTIACLLLLGGEALYGFSVTLFFGVLTGTWSSVTIASTVQERLGLCAEHYQPKPELVDDLP